jgi:hypothetical protein
MKKKEFKDKIVVCGGCGKEFYRTSNRQWWCSRSCGDKFKRKIAKEKNKISPKYHKKCNYCQKDFGTNSNKKLFCSIKHKELFHNELQKKLGLRSIYRQAKLCDGNWHKILQRSNYSCEICGLSSTTKEHDGLVVHHLDGNGTYMTNPNNNTDNLIVLCRKCHKMFHGLSIVLFDGEWKIKSNFLKLLGLHSIGVL